jgi:hypothetical protein
VYYPEDPAKEPIGVVFYQGKFHRFFHSEMTGNPYLGSEHKEVNQYELFEDDTTTEGSTKELSLSGRGVALVPNRVRVSHVGPVGTAEDLLSQTTKSRYHVMSQVIRITCEIT